MNPRVRNIKRTPEKLKCEFNKGALCWSVLNDYIKIRGSKTQQKTTTYFPRYMEQENVSLYFQRQ